MKRIIAAVILMVIVPGSFLYPCAAQDSIKKIIDNGDDASRLVFVFIAEGYTQAEMPKFDDDCHAISSYFFSSMPWHDYQSFVNVYSIFSFSNQSGADIPSEDVYVDTAFDAAFDSFGINSLLTVNDAKVFETAAQVPAFDAVFVLVNDARYGGSGGSTIVLSMHTAAGEIALHEAGHFFGHLADEYETPYSVYPTGEEEPNITVSNDRGAIKWKDWIDQDIPLPTPETINDRIGLFEGARYSATGVYRSKHNCKMRNLSATYCEICAEALVRSIYTVVNPIDKYGPAEDEITITDKAATLWIEPMHLTGGEYEIIWDIDGKIVSTEQTSYEVQPYMLGDGKHTVRVWLRDTTSRVRTDADGLLTSQHTWIVQKNPCGGRISGTIIDVETGTGIANATIMIVPTSQTAVTAAAGDFSIEGLACGSYSILINAPGFEEAEQEIFITDEHETVVAVTLNRPGRIYSINGTVSGSMVEGVTIKLYGQLSSTLQTSAEGQFIFKFLPAGLYLIIPESPGYRFLPGFQIINIGRNSLQEIKFSCYKKIFSFN